jgi:UDP-N-acetylmuramoyl-tripeptide--D-alanyl-D-alanine ligase
VLEVGPGPGGLTRALLAAGAERPRAAPRTAAVGLAAGLEPREIGAGLQTASREPRIIAATGLNGSRVVDESSNASPESGLASLNMLAGLGGRRRIAVFGDMLGLSRQEIDGHRKVGNRAASVVNGLVTVGERARLIADEARRMGLPAGQVFEARSTDEAVEYLRHRLQPGDLVLVKGSPEMHLERIVEAIRVEG